MKDNIKSKKIIIKLGFKLAGSGKKFSISRNEMVEDLNYELRKS
jgi:RimJ/RimL family protein N-acetyltransferase